MSLWLRLCPSLPPADGTLPTGCLTGSVQQPVKYSSDLLTLWLYWHFHLMTQMKQLGANSSHAELCSALGPTDVSSFYNWRKKEKSSFQWDRIYCQGTRWQQRTYPPKTKVLAICAKSERGAAHRFYTNTHCYIYIYIYTYVPVFFFFDTVKSTVEKKAESIPLVSYNSKKYGTHNFSTSLSWG